MVTEEEHFANTHTHLKRLLRPFERGEASRSRDTAGAGLGLSIVDNFFAQHAGTFELRDTPRGGTTAILRLPWA